MLGEELREQPRVFEKLKAARDAGKRGTELIKQLMTFARREELTVGVIEPQKVIAELLPLLRRALGVRITLETKLQANVGAVRASVAQLESAVVNLAVNARDAIDGKGRISIEVTAADVSEQEAPLRGLVRGGRYVAVTVRDTGSGIPPEALGRVFEPFFSTKGERGGTGLGLSMVRWFAEHTGGSAAIDSVVGQGTTVSLLLPRLQAEQSADANDMTRPLSTLPTGSERVVVLALDEALRATMHQTLEVLGYRVKVASGAEDLLATVAAEQTDLLMVDGLGARRRRHLDPRARDSTEVADHRDRRIRAAAASACPASASRRWRSRSRWPIWRERCGELSTPPQTRPRRAICRAAASSARAPTSGCDRGNLLVAQRVENLGEVMESLLLSAQVGPAAFRRRAHEHTAAVGLVVAALDEAFLDERADHARHRRGTNHLLVRQSSHGDRAALLDDGQCAQALRRHSLR